MKEFLIVCPLVFLAGFVDSIAGGGGLISLPAYLLAGLPPHLALGTNKLSSAIGTTVSTARFCKNGYVDFKLGFLCVPAAFIGSAIGSNLALLIPETAFKYFMLAILPIVAFYVLRNKNIGETPAKAVSPKKMYIICIGASFLIGGYDGFYGPGTGTFLILIYTGLAGLSLKKASGNTKIVNLTSNLAAVSVFLLNGKINYSLGLVSALFCIAGHYTGSGLVMKNGSKIVRPVVLFVLCCLFIKVVTG